MAEHLIIQPPVLTEAPAALDAAQEKIYQAVLDHFSVPEFELKGIDNPQLTEAEKFWLSRECLLRYCRATKWVSQTAATTRLVDTLKWRREFGMDTTLTAAYVEPEAVTGKEILYGFDLKGRPAFYMMPSRQNTSEAERQIHFAVWMFERSMDLMGPGVETIDLLINYADKAKNPSFSTARSVLTILQSHYPERLGMALLLNVPWLLTAFYKLITPLVDPATRVKMQFNPDVFGKETKNPLFAEDMLMKEWWGGSRDFEYKHEAYWPDLVKTCETRKAAWLSNWRALGGKVGVKEWEYKQDAAAAVVPEVASTEAPKVASTEIPEAANAETPSVAV